MVDTGLLGSILLKGIQFHKKHASLDAAVKDYTDKIHRSIVLSRYNVSRKDDVLFPDELIMRTNSVRFA